MDAESEVNTELDELCEAIEALCTTLEAAQETRLLSEAYGELYPSVSRETVVAMLRGLLLRVRDSDIDGLSEDDAQLVASCTSSLKYLASNTASKVFLPPRARAANNANANAAAAQQAQQVQQAAHAILPTVLIVESTLASALRWPVVPEINALPPRLVRRVKAASARVETLEQKTGNLDSKVDRILAAHEAAESLDVDLATLADARETTKECEASARVATEKAVEAAKEVERILKAVQAHEQDASAVVAKCEDAYRVATSKGLAGAFEERALKLNASIRLWTGGLIFALVLGAVIGYYRVRVLNDMLSGTSLSWGAIALHIGIAVVSVGAPFWFAWLATKQIGQRFRLAEDYAFKASVSKAYEGYRKEAISIDPKFAGRLFASALSRLEEAPLRFLADDRNHGSPWHELLHSRAFEKAMDAVPELRSKVADLAAKAIDKLPVAVVSQGRAGNEEPEAKAKEIISDKTSA